MQVMEITGQGVALQATSAPGVSFSATLEKVRSLWGVTESGAVKNLQALPLEIRKLFELQRSTGALQLQVECVSRVADSIGQTLRRVHQLGGGQ